MKNKIIGIITLLCLSFSLIACNSNNNSNSSEIKSQESTADNNETINKDELVNNPKEEYVIKCLKKVKSITGVSAVTEDNDPNHKLNKQGGYTSQVYFTSNLVDQSKVKGNTIIEKGTEGGGSIEVYANEEDVAKRDKYLSAFDGGALSSGSHHILGTCLIRTSDALSASKQKELEKEIIEALMSGN